MQCLTYWHRRTEFRPITESDTGCYKVACECRPRLYRRVRGRVRVRVVVSLRSAFCHQKSAATPEFVWTGETQFHRQCLHFLGLSRRYPRLRIQRLRSCSDTPPPPDMHPRLLSFPPVHRCVSMMTRPGSVAHLRPLVPNRSSAFVHSGECAAVHTATNLRPVLPAPRCRMLAMLLGRSCVCVIPPVSPSLCAAIRLVLGVSPVWNVRI
jgi:hypothetical protein